jgi:hypothetical protein
LVDGCLDDRRLRRSLQGLRVHLRILGCCPKCKGDLEFADVAEQAAAAPARSLADAEPHMVLGIPRI